MKVHQKLHLSATAVIVGGALALGLSIPRTALAACGTIQTCEPRSVCQGDGNTVCADLAPGCTVLSATCLLSEPCGPNAYILRCIYH